MARVMLYRRLIAFIWQLVPEFALRVSDGRQF